MSTEEREDLHLIFKITIDDIRFAKRQQWQLTYYAIILMGTTAYLRTKSCMPPEIAGVIIVGLAVAACWLLIKMELDVRGYRERIKNVRDQLSQKFAECYELAPNYTCFWYNLGFVSIFLLSVAVACLSLLFFPIH